MSFCSRERFQIVLRRGALFLETVAGAFEFGLSEPRPPRLQRFQFGAGLGGAGFGGLQFLAARRAGSTCASS